MADLRYSVDIDTAGAQRALESFKNQILAISGAFAGAFAFGELTQTSARFQDFRTTLELLYRDRDKANAVFEDIKKFAETSVFGVENLTETVVKLKAAGLDPTVEQLRLFADVSSVAADSVGALQAITDLYARTTAGGLGLEDLNRLADRGIPVFTILSEKLGLSRLEIAKVGQSAEGAAIILKALEQGLQETFGGASAARANNLSQGFANLRDSINNAFDAIGQAGLNDALRDLARAITQLIEDSRPLLEVFGQGLAGAIKFVADNLKALTAAAVTFFTVMAVGKIVEIVKAFALLGGVLKRNPLVALAFAAASAAGLLVGLGDEAEETAKDIKKLNDATQGLGKGAQLGGTNLREELAKINEVAAKIRLELSRIGSEFKRNQDYALAQLKLQEENFRLSQSQQEIAEAIANVEKEAQDARVALQQKFQSLTKKEQAENLEYYQKELAAINTNAETSKNAIQTQLRGNQQLRDSLNDLIGLNNQYVTATGSLMQRQAEFVMSLQGYREQIVTQQKLNDIIQTRQILLQRVGDVAKTDQGTLSNIIAEQLNDVRNLDLTYQQVLNKVREAIIEAGRMGTITQESVDKMMSGVNLQLQGIKAANKTIVETNTELADKSREFSYGWRKAMGDYVNDATNAAKVAERVFQKTFQGLEDLLVDFVKTGKFNFKEFVADITEELLRSQIRQLLATIFNPQTGALGGLFGGLGDLFGAAFGGPRGQTPNNPLYVQQVGGGGFGGANFGSGFGGGGLISGGGIGGGTSQGGGILGTISNAVSGIFNFGKSIFTGIGDLFGGFFATGGMIPAGRYGIVGERGPEYVSGPASVTPMQPMQVTYNINAVDAMSFKALVAQDPAFIHAVAMQGAKSIPGRY